MKTKKGPIIFNEFHYYAEEPIEEAKIDMDVRITPAEMATEDGEEVDESEGKFYQFIIPFDVQPDNLPFKFSGVVGQVLQLVDFHGEPNDLDPKDVEQLTRPLIESIETLVYQVTSVTINQGISLNFTANINKNDEDSNEDTEE